MRPSRRLPRRQRTKFEPMKPENLAWSREHFRKMTEGERWVIPRSGLVFQKRGNTLVLVERTPPGHTDGGILMGFSFFEPKPSATAEDIAALKQEYLDFQDTDFADSKRHFEAVGVKVIDGTRTVH